jgi:hypothetical protein
MRRTQLLFLPTLETDARHFLELKRSTTLDELRKRLRISEEQQVERTAIRLSLSRAIATSHTLESFHALLTREASSRATIIEHEKRHRAEVLLYRGVTSLIVDEAIHRQMHCNAEAVSAQHLRLTAPPTKDVLSDRKRWEKMAIYAQTFIAFDEVESRLRLWIEKEERDALMALWFRGKRVAIQLHQRHCARWFNNQLPSEAFESNVPDKPPSRSMEALRAFQDAVLSYRHEVDLSVPHVPYSEFEAPSSREGFRTPLSPMRTPSILSPNQSFAQYTRTPNVSSPSQSFGPKGRTSSQDGPRKILSRGASRGSSRGEMNSRDSSRTVFVSTDASTPPQGKAFVFRGWPSPSSVEPLTLSRPPLGPLRQTPLPQPYASFQEPVTRSTGNSTGSASQQMNVRNPLRSRRPLRGASIHSIWEFYGPELRDATSPERTQGVYPARETGSQRTASLITTLPPLA